MAGVNGYGLSVALPAGWEGRIFTHAGDEDSDNRPTLHMGSFALPIDEGDFGSQVIAGMAATGTFMSLVEYTPDCYLPEVDLTTDLAAVNLDPSTSAFSDIGLPILKPADFAPEAVLAETFPLAATAAQYPFSASGRPFVLYVVVGNEANLASSVAQANSVLDKLVISPALAVSFDALQINFDTFLNFAPLINIGSQPPPSGTCTGSGPASAVLARSDAGSFQQLTATLSFSGSYAGDSQARCFDGFVIKGTLTVALSDGRSVDVPIGFSIPAMEQPTIVGYVYLRDDPIVLPAVFSLIGGPCDGTRGVSIRATFVSLLGLLGSALNIPSTVVAASGGNVAVPVAWGGTGVGQGTLSLFQLGVTAPTTGAGARRQQLGRRQFTIRGGATRDVSVRLTATARRLIATRRRLPVGFTVEVRDIQGKGSEATGTLTIKRSRRRR